MNGVCAVQVRLISKTAVYCLLNKNINIRLLILTVVIISDA